jgi:hypothetical protein
MKRYQMRDLPHTSIERDDSTVTVRQAPQVRSAAPCLPCEEKRQRDLEANRVAAQSS